MKVLLSHSFLNPVMILVDVAYLIRSVVFRRTINMSIIFQHTTNLEIKLKTKTKKSSAVAVVAQVYSEHGPLCHPAVLRLVPLTHLALHISSHQLAKYVCYYHLSTFRLFSLGKALKIHLVFYKNCQ